MLRSIWLALAVIAATWSAIGAASAQRRDQRDDWEQLGCVEVGRRPDRDIISVGRREGRFTAIRLSAQGNDVLIEDLKVVYANGQPDDIRVREELRENAETRPLDLQGRDRAIDHIELTLRRDFKGRGHGRATVCVSGFQAEGPRRGDVVEARRGGWEELGCVGVGLRPDFDIIEVGRREGRFKAIRLRAKGGDVDIDNLKVVYGNGDPDNIPVRSLLREGQETRPLDLQGWERFISRIELWTKRDGKGVVKGLVKGVLEGRGGIGRAAVCVDGFEDDRPDKGFHGNRR